MHGNFCIFKRSVQNLLLFGVVRMIFRVLMDDGKLIFGGTWKRFLKKDIMATLIELGRKHIEKERGAEK